MNVKITAIHQDTCHILAVVLLQNNKQILALWYLHTHMPNPTKMHPTIITDLERENTANEYFFKIVSSI